MTAMPNAIYVIFAKTVPQIKLKTVNIGAKLDITNVFEIVYAEKVFVYLANLSVKIQSNHFTIFC